MTWPESTFSTPDSPTRPIECNGDVSTTIGQADSGVIQQRGAVCANGVTDASNERNREGEESPHVRPTHNTSGAETGESSPHIRTACDGQVTEYKPECGENPNPLCCSAPPSSPHEEAEKSGADDA